MRKIKIKNTRTKVLIADSVCRAEKLFEKLKGLLGKKTLKLDEGMLFVGAKQIHMFFMKFAIDVIFMDKSRRVIKIYHHLKPFKITGYFFRAKYALELKAGLLEQKDVRLGDVLEWEEL